MKKILLAVLVLLAVAVACRQAAPVPTATLLPSPTAMPTATLLPTATPTPTPAPTATPTPVWQVLHYWTIEKGQSAPADKVGLRPKLAVVATAEGVTELDGLLSPSEVSEARRADFEKYFVVAVYAGAMGTISTYEINHIVWENDQVEVFATLYISGQTALSFPYHVVRVEKPGNLHGQLQFRLVEKRIYQVRGFTETKEVISASYYIP